MPQEWPLPPTSKTCFIFCSASGQPSYLCTASSVVSFSLENRCSLPMPSPMTKMNFVLSGTSKPAACASLGAAIATVSALRWPSSSHIAARSLSRSSSLARWPPSFCRASMNSS